MAKYVLWKMDRARGREVWMTRDDEDRFCAALREVYPKITVIPDSIWRTCKVPRRDRITGFSDDFRDWRNPDVQPIVNILLPWPGWRLVSKVNVDKATGRRRYSLKEPPPLGIRFTRSRFVAGPSLSPADRRLRRRPVASWDMMLTAFLNVSYCSKGPYVEAQMAFMRAVWRILARLATNRLRAYDLEGGKVVVEEVCEKGLSVWAAEGALDWCRGDPRRLLVRDMGLFEDSGEPANGFRPVE